MVHWVLLVASTALGFTVVGTTSLMVGDEVAIRNGQAVWAAVALMSFAIMHFAIKRRSALAMLTVLPAPAAAAFLCSHFVMGA